MNQRMTLVFVHGNSSGGDIFAPLLASFQDAGFETQCFDLPGHGTGPRPEQYSVRGCVQALVDFIRERDLSHYALIGHSLGGHICLQALPSLAPAGVLVYGTPPLTNPMPSDAFQATASMGCFLKDVVTEEELAQLAQELTQDPTEQIAIKQRFRTTAPSFRADLLNSLLALAYDDEMATLQETQTPVLVAVGEQDRFVNVQYIQRAATQLHNSRVQFAFWPTGHNPETNSPEFFLAQVRNAAHTWSKNLLPLTQAVTDDPIIQERPYAY